MSKLLECFQNLNLTHLGSENNQSWARLSPPIVYFSTGRSALETWATEQAEQNPTSKLWFQQLIFQLVWLEKGLTTGVIQLHLSDNHVDFLNMIGINVTQIEGFPNQNWSYLINKERARHSGQTEVCVSDAYLLLPEVFHHIASNHPVFALSQIVAVANQAAMYLNSLDGFMDTRQLVQIQLGLFLEQLCETQESNQIPQSLIPALDYLADFRKTHTAVRSPIFGVPTLNSKSGKNN